LISQKDSFNSDDYFYNSWTEYEKAINNSINISNNRNSKESEITIAIDSIRKARVMLNPKGLIADPQ
jgi:hypothetical protein